MRAMAFKETLKNAKKKGKPAPQKAKARGGFKKTVDNAKGKGKPQGKTMPFQGKRRFVEDEGAEAHFSPSQSIFKKR